MRQLVMTSMMAGLKEYSIQPASAPRLPGNMIGQVAHFRT
jgi:hypothetical protein